MSCYQTSDTPPMDASLAGGNPPDDSMVIARFPDLDKHRIRKNIIQSFIDGEHDTLFRYIALPRKVLWSLAVVLFLGVCWLILYGSGSESSTDSWQPDPPAAAAPEAPRWNGGSERRITSTVIQESPRRPQNEIKMAVNELDETAQPRQPETDEKASPQVDRKVLPADLHPQSPLVIGTPVPPASLAENTNPDWAALSNSEYYWAVRSRSGDESYRTASRPESDPSAVSRQPSEPRPGGENAAPQKNGTTHLNGVIETPTVRVY